MKFENKIEDGLTSGEGGESGAPEVGENVPDPGGDVTVGDITCAPRQSTSQR